MPQITFENVAKDFGSGPFAVRDLSLVVPDGAFMCLLGPSGCGKTTSLRMVAGLEYATAGTIRIGERVVSGVEQGVFVPAEKRNVGLVFQSYALWPHLTVYQNVEFGLKLRRVAPNVRRENIGRLLETIGISQLADRYPSQLSGGQQQRVALARTLAVNPDVLLMDEPLSNLDARLRLDMRAELKRIHTEFGATIIFVTHDQWEAMTLATDIAVMSDGLLQQVGSPETIYDMPANRFVAEFVGSPPINMVSCEPASPLGQQLLAGLAGSPTPDAIGIRPEHIRIDSPVADALSVDAIVTAILPTGGSWIVETDISGQRIFAEMHERPAFAIGQTTTLDLPRAALHLFDAKGERIATPFPTHRDHIAVPSKARIAG